MLGLNRFAIWILGGAGGKLPLLWFESMKIIVGHIHKALMMHSSYDIGLALGVYILSWRAGSLIHNTAGRIALMAGCAALGMFLSIFLGKMTTIFATVLIGKCSAVLCSVKHLAFLPFCEIMFVSNHSPLLQNR